MPSAAPPPTPQVTTSGTEADGDPTRPVAVDEEDVASFDASAPLRDARVSLAPADRSLPGPSNIPTFRPHSTGSPCSPLDPGEAPRTEDEPAPSSPPEPRATPMPVAAPPVARATPPVPPTSAPALVPEPHSEASAPEPKAGEPELGAAIGFGPDPATAPVRTAASRDVPREEVVVPAQPRFEDPAPATVWRRDASPLPPAEAAPPAADAAPPPAAPSAEPSAPAARAPAESSPRQPSPAEPKPPAQPDVVAAGFPATAPERAAATPETPPAAPPQPAPPARQVAPVAVALALLPQPGSGFTLSLEPAELGRVEIRVTREGERHAVQLVAERPEAAALLLRDLRELDRALEQAGLTLSEGGASLSLAGGGAERDSRQGGGHGGRGGGAGAQAAATPLQGSAHAGLLDVLA
jgi:hypothetical protein